MHDSAVAAGGLVAPGHLDLASQRGLGRLAALQEEAGPAGWTQKLQVLKPGPWAGGGVRHSLDPRAELGDIHYLKGFFLLHYLEMVFKISYFCFGFYFVIQELFHDLF